MYECRGVQGCMRAAGAWRLRRPSWQPACCSSEASLPDVEMPCSVCKSHRSKKAKHASPVALLEHREWLSRSRAATGQALDFRVFACTLTNKEVLMPRIHMDVRISEANIVLVASVLICKSISLARAAEKPSWFILAARTSCTSSFL